MENFEKRERHNCKIPVSLSQFEQVFTSGDKLNGSSADEETQLTGDYDDYNDDNDEDDDDNDDDDDDDAVHLSHLSS